MSGTLWIRLGGLLGALGVIIGAFGAHGFERMPGVASFSPEQLAQSLEWLETGVKYHLVHALAILSIGLFMTARPDVKLNAAGVAFFLGILIFSGILYVMSITQFRKLGAIVPIGGASFIVGWLAVAFSRFPNQK